MTGNPQVSRLALWSILIAFLVMGIKFVAWWLSGSVAIYSDALESIVNVVTAMVAWWAVRLSQKPADKNHPFGHHKVEYFSAVIEGVLIVIAALLIFHQAWTALRESHTLVEPASGIMVNAIATLINGLWAWVLIRAGRRARSPALLADGRHIATDVMTSLGVLVGLALVMLTGWVVLDALIAIVVGLNVLREGWKVVSSSVYGLMDTSVDEQEAALISKTILANARGAIEIHDLKTRMSGPASFIEFHLVVDGEMSVNDAHDICDRIEQALRAKLPGAKITIHVEPQHKVKPGGLKVPS